jgi:Flagellar transcriptional activator (FlhC)
MVHKPTSPEAAKRVLEARALAKAGASSALIVRISGFGPRFVRGLVRSQGGVPSRKPRNPARWMRERTRLAHVPYVVLFYESQYTTSSPADRLLRAYQLYESWLGEEKVLDLDQCAQVIDLYNRRLLRRCRCIRCPHTFLALTAQWLCPKCRLERNGARGPWAKTSALDQQREPIAGLAGLEAFANGRCAEIGLNEDNGLRETDFVSR